METIDFDVSAQDLGRDIPNLRIVVLENDNKVYFKRKDPYGYWYMNMEKGNMPEHLLGAFTTYNKALEALNLYLQNSNRKVVMEVNKGEEVPKFAAPPPPMKGPPRSEASTERSSKPIKE